MWDLLMQVTEPVLQTTHDVVIGPVSFNYPWGENLSDEGLVGALIYLVKEGLKAWKDVETDRAVFGGDEP